MSNKLINFINIQNGHTGYNFEEKSEKNFSSKYIFNKLINFINIWELNIYR